MHITPGAPPWVQYGHTPTSCLLPNPCVVNQTSCECWEESGIKLGKKGMHACSWYMFVCCMHINCSTHIIHLPVVWIFHYGPEFDHLFGVSRIMSATRRQYLHIFPKHLPSSWSGRKNLTCMTTTIILILKLASYHSSAWATRANMVGNVSLSFLGSFPAGYWWCVHKTAPCILVGSPLFLSTIAVIDEWSITYTHTIY